MHVLIEIDTVIVVNARIYDLGVIDSNARARIRFQAFVPCVSKNERYPQADFAHTRDSRRRADYSITSYNSTWLIERRRRSAQSIHWGITYGFVAACTISAHLLRGSYWRSRRIPIRSQFGMIANRGGAFSLYLCLRAIAVTLLENSQISSILKPIEWVRLSAYPKKNTQLRI